MVLVIKCMGDIILTCAQHVCTRHVVLTFKYFPPDRNATDYSGYRCPDFIDIPVIRLTNSSLYSKY